tara:strand:+ start:99 stop:2054 length:1956 start_codon:yes stop_codon:yes gene_type:complete
MRRNKRPARKSPGKQPPARSNAVGTGGPSGSATARSKAKKINPTDVPIIKKYDPDEGAALQVDLQHFDPDGEVFAWAKSIELYVPRVQLTLSEFVDECDDGSGQLVPAPISLSSGYVRGLVREGLDSLQIQRVQALAMKRIVLKEHKGQFCSGCCLPRSSSSNTACAGFDLMMHERGINATGFCRGGSSCAKCTMHKGAAHDPPPVKTSTKDNFQSPYFDCPMDLTSGGLCQAGECKCLALKAADLVVQHAKKTTSQVANAQLPGGAAHHTVRKTKSGPAGAKHFESAQTAMTISHSMALTCPEQVFGGGSGGATLHGGNCHARFAELTRAATELVWRQNGTKPGTTKKPIPLPAELPRINTPTRTQTLDVSVIGIEACREMASAVFLSLTFPFLLHLVPNMSPMIYTRFSQCASPNTTQYTQVEKYPDNLILLYKVMFYYAPMVVRFNPISNLLENNTEAGWGFLGLDSERLQDDFGHVRGEHVASRKEHRGFVSFLRGAYFGAIRNGDGKLSHDWYIFEEKSDAMDEEEPEEPEEQYTPIPFNLDIRDEPINLVELEPPAQIDQLSVAQARKKLALVMKQQNILEEQEVSIAAQKKHAEAMILAALAADQAAEVALEKAKTQSLANKKEEAELFERLRPPPARRNCIIS